ncbi:hypothetical protein EDL81_02915 [Ehrlichia ruminantium]|uniref:type IV secretion system protein n=1 Tax=Ehrlichia ruminantium TaxID=779 RepID=UPI00130E4AAD|nr:type IV secretion system protein [Ehrlichia ruminantium]QGR02586.1 hypothetical protein EDL81_02915 [Ehrlichia ruminantium]
MYNFIKDHFIKLLLLLLVTACESNQHPVPRCIPADVFTEGRTTSVSAYFDPSSEHFISDDKVLGNSVENNQVVRWKYTGYVTNGHPIVLRAEGMWTSWTKSNPNVTSVQKNTTDYGDDDVDRYNAILDVNRVCGPYKKIDKTFSNGTTQCKVSCEMISGVQDDLEKGAYGPPCWFRNGYGAYLLFKRPEDPEPNETVTNMRYPTSPVLHIGYTPLELAGTHGISSNNRKIKDSSCKDVKLEPGWKIYIKILDRNYYDNVGGYTVTFLDGIKSEQEFSAFEWVRKEVRGRLDKAGEDLFKNIVKNPVFKNFVFSLLTLFLIFGSLAYILGIVRTPFADVIVRLLKMALMLLLISPNSWDFFYNHLLRLFVHGTDQIIAMINSYTGDYNPQAPFSFMDIMIRDKIFSPVIWKIKIRALIVANFSSIFAVLVIVIAVLIYIALCIYGFVIYLTAFVGITFLVGLMPILLLGILFSQFKSLFDGWLTQCISFSLQAILVFTLISLFGTLIMNYYYRIFGFTVCYNEWMKVKICIFGKVGCLINSSLFGWTPGQTYDPKVIGISSDFNVSDKKSSGDDTDDIKMFGNARYKFTSGGGYIDVPPDRKYKDFRYIDYPFLDPDTESDSNPHGVNVAKDSKFKELSNLVNALLTTDKKYVVARLVNEIKTELESLQKSNAITLESKNKVLNIIDSRINTDKSANKDALDKYGDQSFKSQIINSVITDIIGGEAITPTSQEKLNEQYDYTLIKGIWAGDLILWSEVGSLFLAALLIWQMRAFVQSVAVSLAGGSMMSQTIASMYEEGFLKTFSSIPVIGKVFRAIDGGLDSYKLLVGNYITETVRRPLNMLEKVPVLGHAVKFTGKVTGGLTSSYGEYDRRYSSSFKQLNYARAFIGAHLGFSPLSAMKYLGGYAAGKMLGNRSGGLIHNMIQDRKAALDSLKAHMLGPQQHKPSPYLPNKKEDDSNPFAKSDAKNMKEGDSHSPSKTDVGGSSVPHTLDSDVKDVIGSAGSLNRSVDPRDYSPAVTDVGSVTGGPNPIDNDAGNMKGVPHALDSDVRNILDSSSSLSPVDLGGQSSLLDDSGNVCVNQGNLGDALEAREQLKLMSSNTQDEAALRNINYDIDRLDSALKEHLGSNFDKVTGEYASSYQSVEHPTTLSDADYKLNVNDISRLGNVEQVSDTLSSSSDTGFSESSDSTGLDRRDVGSSQDGLGEVSSANVSSQGEAVPQAEGVELEVLRAGSGEQFSSETGPDVQSEVQASGEGAELSSTRSDMLDIGSSQDGLGEVASADVFSQGEAVPQAEGMELEVLGSDSGELLSNETDLEIQGEVQAHVSDEMRESADIVENQDVDSVLDTSLESSTSSSTEPSIDMQVTDDGVSGVKDNVSYESSVDDQDKVDEVVDQSKSDISSSGEEGNTSDASGTESDMQPSEEQKTLSDSEDDREQLDDVLQANPYHANEEILDLASLESELPNVVVGSVGISSSNSDVKDPTTEESDNVASDDDVDFDEKDEGAAQEPDVVDLDSKVKESEADSGGDVEESTAEESDNVASDDDVHFDEKDEGAAQEPDVVDLDSKVKESEADGSGDVEESTAEESDNVASDDDVDFDEKDEGAAQEPDVVDLDSKVKESEADSGGDVEESTAEESSNVASDDDVHFDEKDEGAAQEPDVVDLDSKVKESEADSGGDVEESTAEETDDTSDQSIVANEEDQKASDGMEVEETESDDTIEEKKQESDVESTEESEEKVDNTEDMSEQQLVVDEEGTDGSDITTGVTPVSSGEGIAAVHQASDDINALNLQKQVVRQNVLFANTAQPLNTEGKGNVIDHGKHATTKESSETKKAESKGKTTEKKDASKSTKTKKTSLPKMMSGIKTMVSGYAKQISTEISNSLDKFFEDSDSKKRGKKKHSKEEIESMVRNLEQLLDSLKLKKSTTNDPAEIIKLDKDIEKLESTIKSILDDQ